MGHKKKARCVRVATPHGECNHYVLQTVPIKTKIKRKRKETKSEARNGKILRLVLYRADQSLFLAASSPRIRGQRVRPGLKASCRGMLRPASASLAWARGSQQLPLHAREETHTSLKKKGQNKSLTQSTLKIWARLLEAQSRQNTWPMQKANFILKRAGPLHCL